jgi:N-acetylmuramoyl-L-alanine amidase
MPDTLVYSPNNNKNDYNDDYQSRGLWVNYLIGDPYPSAVNSPDRGLGLPVDISFAFHTDAGVTPGDSIIGTLAIYSTGADYGKFPDSTSRMASRDLSDIIQTQVVDDLRSKYKTDWTRRGIWDRPYSEARRPNVPAVLLELLSHQNLSDQRFGLDPRFRFDESLSTRGYLNTCATHRGANT